MKKINFMTVIVLSVFLVFPPNVLAEAVGTVTCIEGRVDRLVPGEEAYSPLKIGEEVSVGDTLRTKSHSKATVTFMDDSRLQLGDSSQVAIKDYRIGAAGMRESGVIDLDRGKIRAVVSKTKDLAPFDITTPNAMGTVKGSDIFVSFQQSSTNVLVADGTFNMKNLNFPDEVISIKEGMTTVVPYNAPPQEPRKFADEEKNRFEVVTSPTVMKIDGVSAKAEFTKAVVADISGAALVTPKDANAPHAPVKGEVLNAGDAIETGKNGSMKIACDNGLSIELRPNTQLIITKLTRDPETGDYNNEFESKYGMIISRLQNKPQGSTFQIKTPNAACGIRGTIMYLEILPKATKGYFEGGGGYVTDLINGIEQIIGANTTFTVDINGDIIQVPTSSRDRIRFNSQWGDEGQGGYDAGDDTGAGDLPDDDTDWYEEPDKRQPFDEVKPPPNVQNRTKLEMTIDAKMGSYGSFNADGASSLTGTLVSDPLTPRWKGIALANGGGDFVNPNGKNLFFGSVSGVAEDGGYMYGRILGSGQDDTQDWRGVLAGIYIDSGGVAGTMFGGFGGQHTEGDSGTFGALGNIYYVPVTPTDIPPEALADPESVLNTEPADMALIYRPEVSDDLSLDLSGNANFISLIGKAWGIWEAIYAGRYDRSATQSSWLAYHGEGTAISGGFTGGGELVLGGETIGGGGVDLGPADEYYAFTTISGTDDLAGNLRLDLVTAYMDHYELAAALGSVVGTYEDAASYYFEGVGAGIWDSNPLTFVSRLNAEMRDVDVYFYGGYENRIDPYAYYDYEYNSENTYGYTYHYRSTPYWYTYTYYYEDGTTETYDYFSGYSYGTWDTSTPLKGIVDDPPIGYVEVYNDVEGDWYNTGGISALIGGTTPIWGGPTSFLVMGALYAEDNGYGHIWTNEVYSYNYDNDTFTTYDGGAYRGYIGGTYTNPVDGKIIALYIDPLGNAGYLKGQFLAQSFEDTGFVFGEGLLVPTQMVSDIGIAPEDLYFSVATADLRGSLSGAFGAVGTGEIYADESLHTMSIVNYDTGVAQTWGIYGQDMGGGYYNPLGSATWSAVMGGMDQFGIIDPSLEYCGNYNYFDGGGGSDGYYEYSYNNDKGYGGICYYRPGAYDYYIEYHTDGTYAGYDYHLGESIYGTWDTSAPIGDIVSTPPDEANAVFDYEEISGGGMPNPGVWLADITNGTWQNGRVAAGLNGTILTMTWLGTITGDISGLYDEEGSTWMAVGGGVWQATTPLTFSGIWGGIEAGGGPSSVYYTDGVELWHAGDDFGLIGATVSPWNGAASFLARGGFSEDEVVDSSTQSYVWNTPLASYNVYLDNGTTIDGGAFFGYSAGILEDDTLDGKLLLLYIDPAGRAGVLRGLATGDVYEDLGMWELTGTLTPEVIDPDLGIAPEKLVDFRIGEVEAGRLAGQFESGGTITGEDQFTSLQIVDHENGIASGWGIYSHTLWGELDKPLLDVNWSAAMGGMDSLGITNPHECVDGQYCYYNEIAANVGTYSFNYSSDNSYGSANYYYYDDVYGTGYHEYYVEYYGDGTYSGYDYALTTPISGTWDPSSEELSNILGTPPDCGDPDAEVVLDYTSSYGEGDPDMGYWVANIDGSAVAGVLSGTLTGRFISPNKIATMTGEIDGRYFPSLGTDIWQAVGLGQWQAEPLTFVGLAAVCFTYDEGDMYGIFGSAQSLWEEDIVNALYMGEYFVDGGPSIHTWSAMLSSYDYLKETPTTYDGGAFVGYMAGYVKNPAAAVVRAVYADPADGFGIMGGTLYGESYPGIEMFSMAGLIKTAPMPGDFGITPEELIENIYTDSIDGSGYNDIMYGDIMMGEILSVADAGWGIWAASFEGARDGAAALDSWSMPISGAIAIDVPYLAVMHGDEWVSDGHMDATIEGIWVVPEWAGEDQTWGVIKGDVVMNNEYIEAGEEFVWAGAAAGEWVEVEDLLDLMDITSSVEEIMSNFNEVMIPITDTLSHDQVFGHILSANMDIALYSFDSTNIWASIINGTYDQGATVEPGWGADLASAGGSSVSLEGVGWADNQWTANVTGEVDGNSINGTAAGTYGGGSFSGAGAGEWGAAE